MMLPPSRLLTALFGLVVSLLIAAVRFLWTSACLVLVPIAHECFGYPLTPGQRFALRAGLVSSAVYNPVMTGVAVKFFQDASAFAGLKLFPAFYTGQQAENYYVFGRENMLTIPRIGVRAPGTAAGRSTMRLSGDTYSTKERVHEGVVDDRERAKYSIAIDADTAEVNRVSNIIAVNHEIRVHDLATDTTKVANSSPGTKWDQANSTPVTDVKAGKELIRQAIGLKANVMVINNDVLNVLSEHPSITEKIKYTQRAIVTAELIAAVFELDEVIVAGALVNSANEGQVLSPSDIWGDDVVLCHRETAQDLKAPNFGRTFMWTATTGAGGTAVKSYRDENVNSDVHKVWQDTDEKLVGPEAGYLLSNVLNA